MTRPQSAAIANVISNFPGADFSVPLPHTSSKPTTNLVAMRLAPHEGLAKISYYTPTRFCFQLVLRDIPAVPPSTAKRLEQCSGIRVPI